MSDYKLIPITVDIIIEKDNKILMIRRKSNTFNNYLAFPGGFVDYGETIEHAAVREAKEEVNVDIIPKHILGVYSATGRDPRGHVISVVFICDYIGFLKAGDDAVSYEWIPLDQIKGKKLAFDHNRIIENYIDWKMHNTTFWSTKK